MNSSSATPRFSKDSANQEVLENAWIASGRMLTADDLEVVAFDPDVITRLAVKPEYEAAEREQQRRAAQIERERIESESIRAEMLAWLTEGPREAQLKKAGAYPTVYQIEVKKERERLAAMSHTKLVTEVTDRREKRRIKGLSAKEYRAQVAVGYEQNPETQPVVQPKMQAALSQVSANVGERRNRALVARCPIIRRSVWNRGCRMNKANGHSFVRADSRRRATKQSCDRPQSV